MKLKIWHIMGFVFVLVFGIYLHYAYELSGYNKTVGYFSSVNESIWEHLKLIFWPAIIFSVAEYFFYGKEERDFFLVKLAAIFSAMCFIVVFFYTYSGILGFSLVSVDILSFVVADILCQFVSYKLFLMCSGNDRADSFRAFVILVLVGLCFVMWTYNPPELGIFWG